MRYLSILLITVLLTRPSFAPPELSEFDRFNGKVFVGIEVELQPSRFANAGDFDFKELQTRLAPASLNDDYFDNYLLHPKALASLPEETLKQLTQGLTVSQAKDPVKLQTRWKRYYRSLSTEEKNSAVQLKYLPTDIKAQIVIQDAQCQIELRSDLPPHVQKIYENLSWHLDGDAIEFRTIVPFEKPADALRQLDALAGRTGTQEAFNHPTKKRIVAESLHMHFSPSNPTSRSLAEKARRKLQTDSKTSRSPSSAERYAIANEIKDQLSDSASLLWDRELPEAFRDWQALQMAKANLPQAFAAEGMNQYSTDPDNQIKSAFGHHQNRHHELRTHWTDPATTLMKVLEVTNMPPKRATEHLIAESAEDLRSPGVIPFLLQHSPELLLHTYRRLSPAQTRDIPEIDWKGILPKYVAGDISGHAFLRFMTELKDRRHEKPLLKKLLADFVKEMNSLNKNDLKRLIRRDPRRFIQVLVQSSLALGKPVTLLSQIDPETFVGRPSGDRLEELISLKTIMKNTLGQSSVHTPEVETFVKAVNRTIWSRLPVSTAKHMLEYGEPEDVIVLIEDEPKRHDIIDAALTALPKGSWQDASYRAAFLVHGIEEPRYREQLEGIIRLAKSLKLPEYPEVMDAIRLRLGSSHENTRLAAQRLLDEYDSDIKQRPAPQEAPKSDPACGDLMSRLQRDNNP